MSEPIRAAYSLEPSTVRALFASHQKVAKSPSRGVVRFVTLAAVSLAGPFLLLQILHEPPALKGWQILSGVTLYVGTLWFLLWLTRPDNPLTRGNLRCQPAELGPDPRRYEFEFWPTEVRSTSFQVTSIHPWSTLQRFAETSQGYLLYLDEQRFLWIPPGAFRSGDDMARFAELAKSKVAHYVVTEPCRFLDRTNP